MPTRDVLDPGVRVDREPVAVGQLLHALAGRAAVEHAHRVARAGLDRLVAEHDVLGNRHHRDEHEVLVHHADPEVDRVVGELISTGLPSTRISP